MASYAGTFTRTSQRLVVSEAAVRGWPITTLDVKKAFLKDISYDEIAATTGEARREAQGWRSFDRREAEGWRGEGEGHSIEVVSPNLKLTLCFRGSVARILFVDFLHQARATTRSTFCEPRTTVFAQRLQFGGQSFCLCRWSVPRISTFRHDVAKK